MTFKILLIDDSALSRRVVRDIAEELPGVTVIGEAVNGKQGIDMMERLKPDLAILDVEMPILNGLQVLEERKKRKIDTAVLMLSVLTKEQAETTFKALELGALDFVPKPSAHIGFMVDQLQSLLKQKITEFIASRQVTPTTVRSKLDRHSAPKHRIKDFDLVLIGSSTGGPQCLHRIFSKIPASFELPICVVQHMPPVFTAAFANRLNSISQISVFEAETGMTIQAGQAVIAKGGIHLALEASSGGTTPGIRLKLDDSPPVNAHRPAVDFTLKTAIQQFGGRILAIIMTGMGRDGVDGLHQLKRNGGFVLAQDEGTSVVFGMNRRAIEEGVVDLILPDYEIADFLADLS